MKQCSEDTEFQSIAKETYSTGNPKIGCFTLLPQYITFTKSKVFTISTLLYVVFYTASPVKSSQFRHFYMFRSEVVSEREGGKGERKGGNIHSN